MSHKILVIENNRETAAWFQDRLELGLFDVTADLAYNDSNAFDAMEALQYDLVFLNYDLGLSKNGVNIVKHIKKYPGQFFMPRAAWVHTPNILGGEILMAGLEDLLIPCCKLSADWCKQNPIPFIETVQDVLGALPRHTTTMLEPFLLH